MATENQKKVSKIADCLYGFKMSDSIVAGLELGAEEYRQRCREALSFFGVDITGIEIDFDNDATAISTIRNYANDMLAFADDISNFVARAAAAGFAPPSNPMLEIIEFNETRVLHSMPSNLGMRITPVSMQQQVSDDVMFNIGIFLQLMEKERNGELDLLGRPSTPSSNSAQISSYDMSFAGYDIATTGEGSDILSFLPDADMIKRRRVRQALGALNFSNREPKVLFTANYDPDGISKGCIVSWMRITDASGYKLIRHDLFNNETIEFNLPNNVIESHYESVKSYVEEWALSFYEVPNNRVLAFLDNSIKRDNIYTYKLQAYQNIRTDKNFVFGPDVSPLILSNMQMADIKDEMDAHAQNTLGTTFPDAGADDISPYPFISKKLYGHDKFDWILAATNVKASIDRGEDRPTVRSFSYIGAKLSELRVKVAQGKFFKPIDPNEITRNVNESIRTYGLSQTILEVIELTGLAMFFGTRESPQEDTFMKATSVIGDAELDEIGTILSSIDAETATVDVSVLTANLLNMLRGQSDGNLLDETSIIAEVSVPDEDDAVVADDPLQFVSRFDPGEEILDLATFEGISDFIRITRLFFDMVPNRNSFGQAEFADRPPAPPEPPKGGVERSTTAPDTGGGTVK